jgi:ATP-dependent Zn protease
MDKVVCSDIKNILECENLKEKLLCTYAKKFTYSNLEGYSTSPETSFLCLWNVEEEKCESKNLGKDKRNGNKEDKNWIVIMIIILWGVIIIMVIILVMIMIAKRMKSRKNMNIKEYEIHNLNGQSSERSLDSAALSCLFSC